jgi:hypothetical protein
VLALALSAVHTAPVEGVGSAGEAGFGVWRM